MVVELVKDGYLDHLLFSYDVCMKVQCTKYGGFGYTHLLENVASMLNHHGVGREAFEVVTRENSKRLLTFAEPE